MWRKSLQYLLLLALLAVFTLLLLDRWISWRFSPYIYEDAALLPDAPVGLVLGTAKYISRGKLNTFYTNRIDGAAALYHEGKIKRVLVSGDNAQLSYNEPRNMRRDLIKDGVPPQAIVLDFAGFRTLDSVVRAKKVFDTEKFIIITQRFHCERALMIAHHYNINAVCFAVSMPDNYLKTRTREIFARLAAVSDLYLLGSQPRFLGPKEPIPQGDVVLPEQEKIPALTPTSPGFTAFEVALTEPVLKTLPQQLLHISEYTAILPETEIPYQVSQPASIPMVFAADQQPMVVTPPWARGDKH